MIAWLIACRGSSIDHESNNVTLFNLLERLTLPPDAEGTTLAIEFEIIAQWRRGDTDDESQPEEYILVLKDPDGEVIGDPSAHVVDLQEHGAHRMRWKSSSLPLGSEGTYWFELSNTEGDDSAAYPLQIRYREA